MGLTLGISGLGINSQAQAMIPAPIKAALDEANVSEDDVSLMIVPIESLGGKSVNTDNQSRLPDVVIPQDDNSENNNSDLSSNSDDINLSLALKSESDATTPQPLPYSIRHLADVPRTPASTMKLIPTFIALDLLGPNFKWVTNVYHTGYVSADTLYGDLIIKGSGDPKLTHKRLAILLDKVRRTGIRHIKGDIVLDASVFQDVGKDPASFDNDPLRPYNASPDGLLINFNSLEVITLAQPNGSVASVFYQPRLADYNLPSSVTMRSGTCAPIRYSLDPEWTSQQLIFHKSLPNACSHESFYVAYPDVKDFSKRVVKDKWLNLGNSLSGRIKFLNLGNTLSGNVISTEHPITTRFGNYLDMQAVKPQTVADKITEGNYISALIPAMPVPLVSYPSLPLSNQIYDINHHSNNVMTEQITLSLPLYANKTSPLTHQNTVTADSKNTEDEMASSGMQSKAESGQKIDPFSSSYYSATDNHVSNYPKALATINQWWQTNLASPAPIMTNGSGLCRDCTVTADNLIDLLRFAYTHQNFDIYVNSLGVAGVSGTIAEHAQRFPNSAAIGRAWIKTGTLNNVTAMAGYVHGQSGQDYIVVGIINPSYNLNTYKARYALDTMLDWTARH